MTEAHGRGLNANALKLVAIIAMLIDHVAWLWIPTYSVLGICCHMIGRMTAPIMCFFVAEGYFHTSNVKRYLARLFIFAALSHVPYILCFDHSFFEATSVIWGLALGLLSLAVYMDEKNPLWLKLVVIALSMLLSRRADWGYMTIVWIMVFGIFRNENRTRFAAFAVTALLFFVLPTCIDGSIKKLWQLSVLLPILPLSLYNGKRGNRTAISKWGFYAFYPAHMLLLWALDRFLL